MLVVVVSLFKRVSRNGFFENDCIDVTKERKKTRRVHFDGILSGYWLKATGMLTPEAIPSLNL
jgi:hypothetical protein